MKVFSCLKCSKPLFLESQVKEHTDLVKKFKSHQSCNVFLDKQSSWMDCEHKEGTIYCPQCTQKLGQFCWHGNTCSCGELVIPYIAFTPSKLLITTVQ
ncbi:Dual specificity phosphatase [Spironucleus salmonicida]|uniref:protein-tyrosine-phosphatase n=1 Tax=Spironucleus salmonicida TaxID=348837 RepID=V6LZK8_9EUKA|nr:Dual specificity phosphatase [Spironucleus salmonicida]|eukprot:EST49171.1 Dual specificity phosphatase [Spironucleus salmonicida]